MKRLIVTLVGALLTALPAPTAQAQPERFSSPGANDIEVMALPGPRADAGSTWQTAAESATKRNAALTEDMEIMTRILDEAMEAAYGRPLFGIDATGALVKSTQGRRSRVPDALAAYLEGHGVVYQLTAPRLFEEPEKKKTDDDAAESVTRWEATRLRIQGKTDTSVKAQADAPGKTWPRGFEVRHSHARPTKSLLVEGLLDMLAENGHNFRELKPDERVTVAITFSKEEESSAGGGQNPGGQAAGYGGGMYGGSAGYGSMGMFGEEDSGGMEEMMGSGMMGPGGMMEGGDEEGDFEGTGMRMDSGMGMDMGSGMGMGMDTTDSMMGGMSSAYGSAADAGDLHLRQGNYQKAVETYEKVIRNAVKADPYKHTPASRHVPLYQKLIQALVGNAQYAEARELMEAIEDGRAKPGAGGKTGSQFPARLVVSANKSDLDQVAEGKMTRQEFDKRATVEYVDPQAVKAGEQ